MPDNPCELTGATVRALGATLSVIAGIAVGAAADLGTEDTSTQRLAPVIAGVSLALAIGILGSPRGRSIMSVRITKGMRFALASVSAVGWLVGMLAVMGWVLPSPGHCPGGVMIDPETMALIERGVDPCPDLTAAARAQDMVAYAGVAGFFVILAIVASST